MLVLIIMNLLRHDDPFPLKPFLQMHSKLPSVSKQSAFGSQFDALLAHSSISVCNDSESSQRVQEQV